MKKNILYICLIVLIIILAIFTFGKNNQKEEIKKSDYTLVDDYSLFYTVSGCVSNYVKYYAEGNRDNLYKLLDSNYLDNNNIDVILEEYSIINEKNVFFKPRMMYQKKLDDKYDSFYVLGDIYKTSINNSSFLTKFKVEVVINKEDSLFKIIPYNGTIFDEVNNGNN